MNKQDMYSILNENETLGDLERFASTLCSNQLGNTIKANFFGLIFSMLAVIIHTFVVK